MTRIGLPVYPGAVARDPGVLGKRTSDGLVSAAYFKSADPVERVERFYAHHLPPGSLKMYIDEKNGGVVDFLITTRGNSKQVVLTADSNGGSLIALSSTMK